MALSLKERFARLGLVRGVAHVRSGSRVVVSLRPGPKAISVKPVDATLALAKRGVSLLRAKRAVEEMIETGRAIVVLPKVESEAALGQELADAGCVAASVAGHRVDARQLRQQLGLTQDQFALRYGLNLQAVRNWEHRRRNPDPAAQSLLRVIARMPEEVSAAQETPIAGRGGCDLMGHNKECVVPIGSTWPDQAGRSASVLFRSPR